MALSDFLDSFPPDAREHSLCAMLSDFLDSLPPDDRARMEDAARRIQVEV